MSKHVPEFRIKFSKETNYTSPLIQNTIFEICAKNVRDKIISEIGDGVFGIMWDKARCFKEEQLSLCVRYCIGLNVVERFIGFIHCSKSKNASALSEHILKYLNKCGLNPEAKLVAQSYDGANVMSGKFKGVQANIKQKYPYAIFTHCMAHKSQLSCIKYVQNCKRITDCFLNLRIIIRSFFLPNK